MKIMIVTAEYCFPPNSGGKIYTYQNLKMLNEENNEIYLFTFTERNENKIEPINLENVVMTKYYKRKSKLNIFGNLNKPIGAFTRTSMKLKSDISKFIEEKEIDILILEWPQLYYNIPDNIEIPVVVMFQNIESNMMKTIAKEEKSMIKKLMYYRECMLISRIEKKISEDRNIKGYIFISQEDLNCYNGKYNSLVKAAVIGIGLNFQEYYDKMNEIKPRMIDKKDKFIISYIGKMNYISNVQSIIWFIKNVFYEIMKTNKNVQLYIVGKDPVPELVKLSSSNIVVTGTVKDTAEFYIQSDLIIAPLQSGGGIKIKLVEAAAFHKLVLVTSKAVEGMGLIDNKDILIADTKEEFVEKCEEIIKDKSKYDDIVTDFYQSCKDKYDFNSIKRELVSFLSLL